MNNDGNAWAVVDTTTAHPARVYDYLLGGKDNWPADQKIGERLISAVPTAREEARSNRAFLRRAVRYAAGRGVTQFLDIGTGIPTVGPTHEAARTVQPRATVIYVDNDPVVVCHARALLVEDDLTYAVLADAREPEAILGHPQVRRRLDFGEPVALMFIALLHFVSDAELDGLIDRYARELAPGSHLMITHVPDTPETAVARAGYRTTTPSTLRSHEEIARLFTGWELVEPGVVHPHEWRPDDAQAPRGDHLLGGVAVKA